MVGEKDLEQGPPSRPPPSASKTATDRICSNIYDTPEGGDRRGRGGGGEACTLSGHSNIPLLSKAQGTTSLNLVSAGQE